nr:hypothetical protein [Clostridioides difficile]
MCTKINKRNSKRWRCKS